METTKSDFYAALIAARKEFPKLVKDTQGQRASHKYADLAQVLDLIVPVLNKHDIHLEQPTDFVDGYVILETRLVHAPSGQFTVSRFPLVLDEANVTGSSKMQREGGMQTYHKRYQLLNLLGIWCEGEDTDGEEPAPRSKPAYVPPTTTTASGSSTPAAGAISIKQLGLLKAKLNGNTEKELAICSKFNIPALTNLPWKHMNEALEMILGATEKVEDSNLPF